MKTKLFLSLIFLTTTAAVNAQTYTVSKTVNVFGDTIKTYKQNGVDVAVEKYSTDIFGNKVITTTGPNGQEKRSVTKSKDVFGNEVVDIYDGNSYSTATIKKEKDIFGNEIQHFFVNGSEVKTIKTSTDIFGGKKVEIEELNRQPIPSTEIFNDGTTHITDANGQEIRSVKKSTSLFGGEKVEIRDAAGQPLFYVKSSQSMFGEVTKKISGPNGEKIGTLKKKYGTFSGIQTIEIYDHNNKLSGTIENSIDSYGIKKKAFFDKNGRQLSAINSVHAIFGNGLPAIEDKDSVNLMLQVLLGLEAPKLL